MNVHVGTLLRGRWPNAKERGGVNGVLLVRNYMGISQSGLIDKMAICKDRGGTQRSFVQGSSAQRYSDTLFAYFY